MFHVKHPSLSCDVAVVGGGHAGVEAAHAAFRQGASVILLTHRPELLGEMSCNPSIGGVGKSHLVREVDALDGLMGRCADAAGLVFKLLNRSRGPAVQAPRVQCDKVLYRDAIRSAVAEAREIRVIAGDAARLLMEHGRVSGLVTGQGTRVSASAVVIATGTFLNGRMHTGDRSQAGGRAGEATSSELSIQFRAIGFRTGRLKTGTPPRLLSPSIDYRATKAETGDSDVVPLSLMSPATLTNRGQNFATQTNTRTHAIVVANLSTSAMFTGRISGVGPRYCPSLEDKVTRFADRSSHLVVLEPETLNGRSIYPNGLSTSLSEEVQLALLRTISGLENVELIRAGYAIEYDFIDPLQLTADLQTRALRGLFLAGQINGTTGYEEAAAQGLVAGLNAARVAAGSGTVTFSRDSSYIGVLLDDLTSRGVTEPYRMFTSRAENRLNLRTDNADLRLTRFGRSLGVVSGERWNHFLCFEQAIHNAGQLAIATLPVAESSTRRPALHAAAHRVLVGEAAYAGLTDVSRRESALFAGVQETLLPVDLDYGTISGLSNELREKLERVKPTSLAEARRIEGMTPAALLLVAAAAASRNAPLRRQG